MIVHSDDPIALIGGGDITAHQLQIAISYAPMVVAADGGADAALANGFVPKAVIGDFDSISDAARAQIPVENLHEITEQDSTDFDKCLRNISAPLIIGVGFSGTRLDHHLAALNTLVRHPRQRCLLLGEKELVFLAPPSLRLDLEPDTALSLFPMGAVEGVSDGLRWPIGGLNFTPDGPVGTSNQITGPVHLSFTAPKMLIILPDDALDHVVDVLQNTNASWLHG